MSRLWLLVIPIVLSLLASCARTPSSYRATDIGPSNVEPLVNAKRELLGPSLRPPLAFVIGPNRVEEIKTVQTQDQAFFLIIEHDAGRQIRRFGWLSQEENGNWRLGDVTGEGLWEEIPESGTYDLSLLPLETQTSRALGGFVDPSLSRVESLDGTGRLVDADAPRRGGTILLTEGWGQIRAFTKDRLVAVLSIYSARRLPKRVPTDEGARDVADTFLARLLDGGWRDATGFLADFVPPAKFLPVFKELMGEFDSEMGVGRPENGAIAYTVPGQEEPGVFHVHMTKESGAWRVWGYSYDASPE